MKRLQRRQRKLKETNSPTRVSHFKILKKINIDVSLIVLYAFNPLVIIEGAGNAHFEVVQVSMMVTSVYLLLEKKLFVAALFLMLLI